MLYKVNFRKRAAKEYIEAITWYKERSLQAAENFINVVRQTLHEIEDQPDHFRIIYKNYHEAKTKRYPYSIVYFIDEKKQSVIIMTLFHHKRNPKNKFK
jgi:plasmid stabilization system protein ParE